jgi:DNA-binding NarL/FixJ family response regulator
MSGASNLKVLIADDSEPVRDRLRSMISELEGVEVIGEAANALGAVAMMKIMKPNVAIIDLRMPEGGGLEVLRQSRKQESGIVKVVLTNYAFPRYRQHCVSEGADFFFDKSGDVSKVAELLSRLAMVSRSAPSETSQGTKQTPNRRTIKKDS